MTEKEYNLIYRIVKLFKPHIDRWIVKAFVGSGLTLVTAGLTGISWWLAIALQIVKEEAKKHYGTDLGITVIEWTTTIFGLVFITIGLIIYFLNKRFEQLNKEKPKQFIAILHKSIDEFLAPEFKTLRNGYYKDYDIQTIVLDQTKTYEDGELHYPDYSVFEQNDILTKIKTLSEANHNTEIGYFGLAHIPLVFYIGTQLADKFKIDLFEYNRHSSAWDYIENNNKKIQLSTNKNELKTLNKSAILIVEISYNIDEELAIEVVNDPSVIIKLSNDEIKLDTIESIEQVEETCAAFRQIIDDLLREYSSVENIHLFYAGPTSLALSLARKISKRTDPNFIVYNYTKATKPKYKWAINLNETTSSKKLIIRT